MCQNSNEFCRENNCFAKRLQHSPTKRCKMHQKSADILCLAPLCGRGSSYGGAIFKVTVLLITPCNQILTEMLPRRLESSGNLTVTSHSQSNPGTFPTYSTGRS